MNRRDLFPAIGAGMALTTLATIVGTTHGCATPAPAAETVSLPLALAIERHRVALAAQEAAGRIHGDREEAARDHPKDDAARIAFDAADEAFDAACHREQEARHAVLAAPIVTLADMRKKAAYLASVSRHMIHDGGTMAMLLASMGAKSGTVTDLPSEPDPMLDLDRAYRKGLLDYEKEDIPTNEAADAACARTFGPHYRRLCEVPPIPTTLAGAIAAVRLVADEEETCGHKEDFTINTLRAALAYFDGRA